MVPVATDKLTLPRLCHAVRWHRCSTLPYYSRPRGIAGVIRTCRVLPVRAGLPVLKGLVNRAYQDR